jgi:hypothetical protein
MKIIILLVKDDIKTHPIGTHLSIETNGLEINLDRDAAIELRDDINNFLNINEQISQ